MPGQDLRTGSEKSVKNNTITREMKFIATRSYVKLYNMILPLKIMAK
jgi:hypothetical protein